MRLLREYADAVPARAAEIDAAIRGHLSEQLRRMPEVPLGYWSAARWQDGLLSVL